MQSSDNSTQLIPGLPDHVALECLARVPHTSHLAASAVCRRWCGLFPSRQFYRLRHALGHTRTIACLVQAVPHLAGSKSGHSYRITAFDPASQTWQTLDQIPGYPDGAPLFCRVVGCQGKLVVMGGWDPATYDQVRDVFVYDFAAEKWEQRGPMPQGCSFFAVGSVGGTVYVAGGHDGNKCALDTAWAYDVDRDKWAELARMTRERDECEGVVVDGKFWVVSGYGTERQGDFDMSAEWYDESSGSGEWRRVEGAWEAGQCPRLCVVGDSGCLRVLSPGVLDSGVGGCWVGLGEGRGLVAGAEYEGGRNGVYLVKKGKNEKWEAERVEVEEFYGFVQSGCCVEV